MFNAEELKRISQLANDRRRAEGLQKEDSEASSRLRNNEVAQAQNEAMADQIIADLPARLAEEAAKGSQYVTVVDNLDVTVRNLLYDPNARWRAWHDEESKKIRSFMRTRRSIERQLLELSEESSRQMDIINAGSLPHHYRKIYDWCIQHGFDTYFHNPPAGGYKSRDGGGSTARIVVKLR